MAWKMSSPERGPAPPGQPWARRCACCSAW
ncbi:Uncharacterised protein [Bordetella pertussis]|nr:Uncharacterised protein [Bordetella pertussis]